MILLIQKINDFKIHFLDMYLKCMFTVYVYSNAVCTSLAMESLNIPRNSWLPKDGCILLAEKTVSLLAIYWRKLSPYWLTYAAPYWLITDGRCSPIGWLVMTLFPYWLVYMFSKLSILLLVFPFLTSLSVLYLSCPCRRFSLN